MSQGASANNVPFEHPEYSWVQGTRPEVRSVYTRYLERIPTFTQEPESVSGAELVGGRDNFAAQAARICAQAVKPGRVSVLLGGNDVCNRTPSEGEDAAANLYAPETWTAALRAGLDQLAECLPPGAMVHVLSAPRVDFLYEAGHAKGAWCPSIVWALARICRIVTHEPSALRRAQLGARINEYNEIILLEVEAYDSNLNGRNPRGVRFSTDWKGPIESGHGDTSIGTFRFGADEISSLDCFHPSIAGQRKVACVAWTSHPEGAGDLRSCFQ